MDIFSILPTYICRKSVDNRNYITTKMAHQKKTISRTALISLVLAIGPAAILSSPIPAPQSQGGLPIVGGLLGGGSSGVCFFFSVSLSLLYIPIYPHQVDFILTCLEQANSPTPRDLLPPLGGSSPIGTDPSTVLNPGASIDESKENGNNNDVGNGNDHGFKKIQVRALHAIPSPSPSPNLSPKAQKKRQSESGSNYNTDGFIDTGFEDGPRFKTGLTDNESHYDKTTPLPPPPPPVVVEQLPPPPPAPAPAPLAPAPAPPAPAPPAPEPECGCEDHEHGPESAQYKKRDNGIWKRLPQPQGGPLGGLTGGLPVVGSLFGGGQRQPPIPGATPSGSPRAGEDEKKYREEERKKEEEKAAEKLAETQREFEEQMQEYAEKAQEHRQEWDD